VRDAILRHRGSMQKLTRFSAPDDRLQNAGTQDAEIGPAGHLQAALTLRPSCGIAAPPLGRYRRTPKPYSSYNGSSILDVPPGSAQFTTPVAVDIHQGSSLCNGLFGGRAKKLDHLRRSLHRMGPAVRKLASPTISILARRSFRKGSNSTGSVVLLLHYHHNIKQLVFARPQLEILAKQRFQRSYPLRKVDLGNAPGLFCSRLKRVQTLPRGTVDSLTLK
jgi:hypothetical protein